MTARVLLRRSSAAGAALLLCAAGPSIDTAGPGDAALASVRDYVERAGGAGFSGVVLVARGDRVLLHRASGRSGCAGRALAVDDEFYVASLTKALTAAAVLRLEADGRLRTTDSLGALLPGVPAEKRGITVHQLLTHTSGIGELPSDADDAARDADAYVRAVLAAPARGAPGSGWRYSNAGYSLLAALVERASGRPFEAYLRDAVLHPAGMRDTRLATEAGGRTSSVRACNGGLDQGDAGVAHHRPLAWSERGAVGAVTTAEDLLRWTRALRTGRVLPPAQAERMLTAHAEGYGYGWGISSSPSAGRLASHTGVLLPEGWNAQLRLYLDHDLTVVVLSNAYDGDEPSAVVARAIGRLLFGGEVAFPPSAANDVVRSDGARAGRWAVEGGGTMEVRAAPDGALTLATEGQPAVDAVLGHSRETAGRLAAANARAERLLAALVSGDGAGAGAEAAGRPAGEWLPRVEETWGWLRGRFGEPRAARVLHSVPAPFGAGGAVTFARVDLARGYTSLRIVWDGERLAGMSDRGAFTGATPAVAPSPAPLPLVPTGDGTFAVFRLVDGARADLRFAADDAGCVLLRVRGRAGEVVARPEGGCGGRTGGTR